MKNQYSKFKNKNGETKHSQREVEQMTNGFTGNSSGLFAKMMLSKPKTSNKTESQSVKRVRRNIHKTQKR